MYVYQRLLHMCLQHYPGHTLMQFVTAFVGTRQTAFVGFMSHSCLSLKAA